MDTKIRRAVSDWIREDTGTTIKMTITPREIDNLVKKIKSAVKK